MTLSISVHSLVLSVKDSDFLSGLSFSFFRYSQKDALYEHKQIFSQCQYFNVVNLSKLKCLVAVF